VLLKQYDLVIDTKLPTYYPDIEFVQGDMDTCALNIQVTDDHEPVDITGLDVEIAFAKPDKTTVLQDLNNGVEIIDAESGQIKCTLKSNTIAAPGRVLAEVRILEVSKLLTTARFQFTVRRSIVNDNTIISTDEFPILTQLLEQVSGIAESEETRQEAEEARVAAELLRIAAESERVSAEEERAETYADFIAAFTEEDEPWEVE